MSDAHNIHLIKFTNQVIRKERKIMKTFLIQKGKAGVRKSLIVTLIMAMTIAMVPVNAFAYTGYPCETDKADANLYPFPIDMKLLSQYLYGSEKNLTGAVKWNYYKSVPREWYNRELPPGLKSKYIGKAIVNTRYRGSRSAAPGYFYPGTTSINYHKKRLEDLSKTKYSYQGPNNPSNPNIAFYVAETTEFKVLGYNNEWVAVWDCGGIDLGRGLSSTCGGLGREQYGSWKPAVYFLKRADVYIMDIRNQDLNIPTVTASGTATCNTYVKTTPASDNYVTSGLIKSNQLFQVTNPTPINGHYQIYYRSGLYYVNAKWVNLKRSNENKPDIQYNAVVKSTDPVNITAKPSDSATAVGAVKDKFKIEVVKKNAGNGYSEVWFNSKKCYIPTKKLGDFTNASSYSTVKKLGKAKGTLVLNGPWSSYGATAYSPAALKILKKYKMDNNSAYMKIKAINGLYPMSDGDSAIVYGVSKYVYKPEPGIPDYKESAMIYKILYNGKICYVPVLSVEHHKFNYYKNGKGKIKAKSETKKFVVWDVKSKSKKLEAYKIKNTYYFKLDDIANMMSKSNKSFNVKYKKNAIVVNSMSPYKGSSALKAGDGVKRTAAPSTLNIIWDGQVIGIKCYKIKGKYYVNPFDIAYLTDSEIDPTTTKAFTILPTYPNEVEAYG